MENVNVETNDVRARPCSVKELSTMYGVCRRTMCKWLVPYADDLGKRQGRYYSIKQVEIIFEKLGIPTIMV